MSISFSNCLIFLTYLTSFSGIIIYSVCNNQKSTLKKQITPEYYDKIYKILYNFSGIANDPYKRTIGKKVVKQFCKIALNNKIKLEDNITDEIFYI